MNLSSDFCSFILKEKMRRFWGFPAALQSSRHFLGGIKPSYLYSFVHEIRPTMCCWLSWWVSLQTPIACKTDTYLPLFLDSRSSLAYGASLISNRPCYTWPIEVRPISIINVCIPDHYLNIRRMSFSPSAYQSGKGALLGK